MGKITAEQVAWAIETPRHIDYRALGAGWRELAPDYVIAAEAADDWDAEHAALTRWHAELVAAETPRKVARWVPQDGVQFVLSPPHMNADGEKWYVTTREQAIAWGYTIEGGPEPVADDSPERLRVDVPQPEPWHARLVRLAQEAQATSKACAEAEAAFKAADAEREKVRKARAAAREACDAARKALTAATTAAAIVEAAQQPAPVAEPTRPEPRFKVGDWVRRLPNAGCPEPFQVAAVTPYGEDYCYVGRKSFVSTVEHALTPALDPALRETARKAVRWLRNGKWPLSLPRVRELPGFDAWNMGPLRSSEWAAQLERLLGDAP